MTNAVEFVRKLGATVLFVLCMTLLAVAFARIWDQNNQLTAQQATLTEQQTTLEKLVDSNSNFVERTVEAECDIRAEARDTLRQVLFAILDEFPQEGTVADIRELIETDYPAIECPDVVIPGGE